MNWQPIETAPKEREKNVLLLCVDEFLSYENSITVGFYGDVSNIILGKTGDGWCDWCAGLDENDEWTEVRPTHWMPLPPEPKE